MVKQSPCIAILPLQLKSSLKCKMMHLRVGVSKLQTSLKSLCKNGDKFSLSSSLPEEQLRPKLLPSMASFVLTESSEASGIPAVYTNFSKSPAFYIDQNVKKVQKKKTNTDLGR